MGQTQKTRTSEKRETETPVEVRSSSRRDDLLDGIDELLDEINEVLEGPQDEEQNEEQTTGCYCYPEGPIPPWCSEKEYTGD